MFALSDHKRLVTFDWAGVGHLSRALIRASVPSPLLPFTFPFLPGQLIFLS